MDTIAPGAGNVGSHRRRRSSLMNPANGGGPDPGVGPNHRRKPSTRTALGEEPKISEEAADANGELDDVFSDEDLHDDEETGLTRNDRQRKRRKRRRNTLLDNRIARDKATAEERKEADQGVVRSLVVNGILILLWYLFSLCISLVCPLCSSPCQIALPDPAGGGIAMLTPRLSLSQYNKWMFDHGRLNFPFPLFTTSAHMLVQFALSALVLYFFPSLRPQSPAHTSDLGQSRHEAEPERPIMTKMFYLTRIGPCGTATGLDIGLGNMSLRFITLTFYSMYHVLSAATTWPLLR